MNNMTKPYGRLPGKIHEYEVPTTLRTPKLKMSYLDFYSEKYFSSRNALICQAIEEWAERHLSEEERNQIKSKIEKGEI